MSQFLAFLKPDAGLRRNVGAQIVRELRKGSLYQIQSFQVRQADRALLDLHYAHVTDRPFYPWLAQYINFSPVYCMLMEGGEDAVTALRDLLGATIVQKADPASLRGRFGLWGGVNCMHLSDSLESGARETALWKERAGLKEGVFDISLDDFAARFNPALPDNTQALRDACARLAAAKQVTDADRQQVAALLGAECPGIDVKSLEVLTESVIRPSQF